ncbi:MAG: hypothetical protein IPL47_12175 [Phyllobacteriaceae bacterium]|nr:hypothetical protein [Phyllobacteriaceae bacterium]
MDNRWSSVLANPDVFDALIGGAATIVAAVLATFTGVLTYVLTQRGERNREREERRAEIARAEKARNERVGDMVRALHAEILSAIVLTDDQLRPEEIAYAIGQATPFATPDETDFVFESLVDDLSILPSEIIHDVVAYYRAAKQTNLMIHDMRDPLFLGQAAAEKAKYNANFIAMVWVLRRRGENARKALESYAADAGIDFRQGIESVERGARAALEESAKAIADATASAPNSLSDDGANGSTQGRNLRSKRNIGVRKGK